jgi:hypothetical protein
MFQTVTQLTTDKSGLRVRSCRSRHRTDTVWSLLP